LKGRPNRGVPLTGYRSRATKYAMAEKLGIGSTFPSFPLTLVDGRTVTLPEDLDGRYRVILFYRGHW